LSSCRRSSPKASGATQLVQIRPIIAGYRKKQTTRGLLLDYLDGQREQLGWHFESERLWQHFDKLESGQLSLDLASIGNFANDSAAAAGGVPIGGIYCNGSDLRIRIS
jgi:hypothetical protein